ncbi:STAS domain-containing protein [Thalassotalea fusca]
MDMGIGTLFKLPKDLTIAQVEECKSNLIQFIDSNDTISIDDSELARIDTVGVQLLLSAVTYIAAQNKTLDWQSSSEILRQSIRQLGVNDTLLEQCLS